MIDELLSFAKDPSNTIGFRLCVLQAIVSLVCADPSIPMDSLVAFAQNEGLPISVEVALGRGLAECCFARSEGLLDLQMANLSAHSYLAYDEAWGELLRRAR